MSGYQRLDETGLNTLAQALANATKSKISSEIEQVCKDTVGWTGKNLLKNTATSQTVNGVTFTVNADGSVTANGTATGNESQLFISNRNDGPFILEPGTYIGSGSPINGTGSTYHMRYNETKDGQGIGYFDFGNGCEFTITEKKPVGVIIYIKGGVTVSNLTFYPMIRKADITDPTYEPYHESVETMYEEEIHGVNLLPITASSQTIKGVTFTVNADKSITANGTATANAMLATPITLSKGRYILNGCPKGGSTSTYNIIIQDSPYTVTKYDVGEGLIFDVTNDNSTYYIYYARVLSGITVNNITFKPMLRKADIEDSTYRPYNEQAIQNQLNAQGVLGAKNLLKNIATSQTINGVTFTVNADKSVTVNGTATAQAIFWLTSNVASERMLFDFPVILSGMPSGGSNTTFAFGGNSVGVCTEPTEYPANTSLSVAVVIYSGYTANNLVFKPMLRLASDPDDTYQPYAMTNKELTDITRGLKVYTAGDRINCGISLVGHVTTGATTLELSLRGLFDNENIRSIAASGKILVRGEKGYIKTSGDVVLNTVPFGTYLKLSESIINPQNITLKIKQIDDTAFTNVDNNTIIDIQALVLEFS